MFQAILKAGTADAPIPITAYKQTCDGCKWRVDGITCDAFPEGIPTEILLGVFDHHAPYESEGLDDGGLQFTPA
jgi:hypothetical protein